MRLLRWLMILITLSPITGMAQFSNVTATLTDADGQIWSNCTWAAVLQSNGRPPSINGTPLTAAQISPSGSCDGSGVLTGTFADSSFVSPAGSYWQITLTPNASAQSVVIQVPIVGASPDYSSQWSSYLGHILFPAAFGAFGYSDAEVWPIPPFGGTYFDVTTQNQRIWTVAGWINNGTGGGGGTTVSITGDAVGSGPNTGVPVTVEGINGTTLSALATGLLKVTTSSGAITVATPGVDYYAPDPSTNSQLTWQAGTGGIGTCLVSPAGTVRTCFDNVNGVIEESDNGGAYYVPPTHIIAGTGVTVACTLNSCTVNSSGTAPGTSGQVIMSNGSGGFIVSGITDNLTTISTSEGFLSTKVGSAASGNFCMLAAGNCIFATSAANIQMAINGTQNTSWTSSGQFFATLGIYGGSSFTATSVGWRISSSNSYWTCNNTTSTILIPLCAAGTTFDAHPVITTASATSTAIVSQITNISGTAAIATMTTPAGLSTTTVGTCINLIPTGLFTFTTGGNILNPTAVVPVVGNLIIACWTGTAWSVK